MIRKALFNISLAITILAFCSCVSTKNEVGRKDAFIFLESEMEEWHGGAPGSNSGTDYYLNVIVNTDNSIYFDSIWGENGAEKIRVLKNGSLINNHSDLEKGDTVQLRVTLLKRDSITDKEKPKAQIDNDQVIIKFKVNDEIKYFVSPTLKEKKGPLRP